MLIFAVFIRCFVPVYETFLNQLMDGMIRRQVFINFHWQQLLSSLTMRASSVPCHRRRFPEILVTA